MTKVLLLPLLFCVYFLGAVEEEVELELDSSEPLR